MKQRPWTGDPPISTTRKVAGQYREIDEEGCEWYVAIGPDGQPVERMLLIAKGLRLAEAKAAAQEAEVARSREEQRAARITVLRAKRRAGKALTAAEKNEVLDLLMGV
jgi:hypothetical protein